MTSPSISSAAPSDKQRAISTIVTAFASDPIARWVFPEPHQYLTYFPQVVPLIGGGAFEHGSAYCADDFAAASLWLPPGAHSDQETLGALAQSAVAEGDQEKVFGFLEQMGVYHPTQPHWYLPFIGVDPPHQGRGYGSALLKHALQNCDRDKLPAYLEATSPSIPPALRASRLRGDRRNPGGRLAPTMAYAPKAALIRPKAHRLTADTYSVPFRSS